MSLQSRFDEVNAPLAGYPPEKEPFVKGLMIKMAALKHGDLIECLDDGFVHLVDHMGNDAAIIDAARVSYGEGTKVVQDDRSLVRYLMRHRHSTPFEMAEFKFHVRVPMDTWRQWIRHRTANVNEYSTRYSEAIDSAQRTRPNTWRLQAKDNKQGSCGTVTEWPADSGMQLCGPGDYLSSREQQLHEFAREIYEERVKNFGVAREQARKDLPLSTYTEAYWKIDLHNLFHFLALRMDSHAQVEIRTYANAMAELVKRAVPYAWEAFEDYRLRSITLSGPEIDEIRALLDHVPLHGRKGLGKREKAEFAHKLTLLGGERWSLAQET